MKKNVSGQKMANNTNIQFLPNQADIQAILPTHELDVLTKFHNNMINFFASVSNP